MPSGAAERTTLGQVIEHLPETDDELTIYLPPDRPVQPGTPAVVMLEEDGDPPAGMRYFLEVDLAQDVLRVWSEWRHDRAPTLAEACVALEYYATHDAFLPDD